MPELANYLLHIESATRIFWEQRPYRSYTRLQDSDTWQRLRGWLDQVASLPGADELNKIERFLLHAAVYLYETGWQIDGAPSLTPKQRYTASAALIRQSFIWPGRAPDLGLSYLDPLTVEILARLCESVGLENLNHLSLEEVPTGYEQTARLRYLGALFQLADLLFIQRENMANLRNLAAFSAPNQLEARLAFRPYIPLINLKDNLLTLHYRFHPDDEAYSGPISAFFEEPLKRWWLNNWRWLYSQYNFWLDFQSSRIEVVHEGIPPEPLSKTCKVLLPLLAAYTASAITLPTRPAPQPVPQLAVDTQHKSSKLDVSLSINPISIFVSYSHQDKQLQQELLKHLTSLQRQGIISVWHDGKIEPGVEWNSQIEHYLDEADVILLLISSDFLASDFCYSREMDRAIERHEAGNARVIPIILRSVDWSGAPFAKLQVLPMGAKPINEWTKRDAAWTNVSKNIRKAIERLAEHQ